MPTLSRLCEKYFILLVLSVSLVAFWQPHFFVGIKTYISLLLGIIMFGMGMTLKAEDFKIALTHPLPLLVAVVGQYAIMPFVGFALAKLMNLPPEIAVGHILVGSCPDGTASNVIVYLSRGNVPLSVATTSVTTLIAPIVTPALVWLFARQWVPVDAYGIFISTLQIVILPIVLGITLRKLAPKIVEKNQGILPLISILAITAVIAAVVALNKTNLQNADANVFIAALLHNVIGLALGYGFASLFRLKIADRRTIAISVGMQNSGLGVALANAHFTALTALPSAIFSVVHNLTGAGLAGYWVKRPMEGPFTNGPYRRR